MSLKWSYSLFLPYYGDERRIVSNISSWGPKSKVLREIVPQIESVTRLSHGNSLMEEFLCNNPLLSQCYFISLKNSPILAKDYVIFYFIVVE